MMVAGFFFKSEPYPLVLKPYLVGLGVVVLVLNQDGVTGTNPKLGWEYLKALGLAVVVLEGVIFIEGENIFLGARL